MRIRPFAALRPPAALAHAMASPPYDVVDTAEARVLAENNPHCFLRISRAELELPDGTDPHADEVYARARTNIGRFKEQQWFVREALECVYVYRQAAATHAQTAVVACCHIDDYLADRIKKHEKTRVDKENDRVRHIDAVNAHTGPVFLTYRDRPQIDALVAAAQDAVPLYDVTGYDRVRHTIWPVPRESALLAELRRIPEAYIADGHHRAAAAVRVGRQRRETEGGAGGEASWFMAALFPASHLRILAYNRVVRDLRGLSPANFLEEVGRRVALTPGAAPAPAAAHRASMYVGGRWYGLAWDVPAGADPVAALDVSVLQDRLLAPVLGIADPRTDGRIAFVGGSRGTAELVRRVDSGRDAVAFSMHPVAVDQVMAIADAGQIMPPKSTWFEPKLLSGLLVHEL